MKFLDVTDDNVGAAAVEGGESREFRWSEDKVIGWKSEFDRDSVGEQVASK
jgi:hypothetical protein